MRLSEKGSLLAAAEWLLGDNRFHYAYYSALYAPPKPNDNVTGTVFQALTTALWETGIRIGETFGDLKEAFGFDDVEWLKLGGEDEARGITGGIFALRLRTLAEST